MGPGKMMEAMTTTRRERGGSDREGRREEERERAGLNREEEEEEAKRWDFGGFIPTVASPLPICTEHCRRIWMYCHGVMWYSNKRFSKIPA